MWRKMQKNFNAKAFVYFNLFYSQRLHSKIISIKTYHSPTLKFRWFQKAPKVRTWRHGITEVSKVIICKLPSLTNTKNNNTYNL